MTAPQLEAIIDQRLAALKKQMMERNGVPIFLIGYDQTKAQRFVIGWAAGERPDLAQCHQLLMAMTEEVAAQLGVT